ncbi:hypothetical protein [Pantoea stewartii]|uniref:hypothetical protein n=1 Tax=Pantoea stewartii TaxID=66269 RepID=UPI00345BAE43
MKKLLVCNVVLLCTLAGLKADDTTPTIHLDKFYTAANNRGALANWVITAPLNNHPSMLKVLLQ